MSKRLSQLGLLTSIINLFKYNDVRIFGLSVDSRKVHRGDLFVALAGVNVHGAQFIKAVVKAGASAILTDKVGFAIIKQQDVKINIPILIKDNPRWVLAKVSAQFFKHQPAVLAAVTGTNGKTSVVDFMRQIWQLLNKKAVSFGTIGTVGVKEISTVLYHTTPEPISLHKLLADLYNVKVTHAAMEASSHGLDQHRLDGVRLCVAGFSTFSHDHMDYHRTVEAYFAAKIRLFTHVLSKTGTAVINMDDRMGNRIYALMKKRRQKVITVGSKKCDLTVVSNWFDAQGQDLGFLWRGKMQKLRLSLFGNFQMQNLLLAAGMVIACGELPVAVFATLPKIKTVRGRMQKVAVRANGASIFVDYAHTPDAVKTALSAMRMHIMGSIVIVLGAGGDRDQSKRVLMGQAAAYYADKVFVTDDNPRFESSAQIRAMIMAGCPDAIEIGDRAEAILRAVSVLQAQDALLIAGKGHERYQIIGHDKLPFDDVEQTIIAVNALDAIIL